MTRITLLQIYLHPYDLDIAIGKGKHPGSKYAYGIFRGPDERCRPLLTSEAVFESPETAQAHIREVLSQVEKMASGEVNDSKSVLYQFIEPDALDRENVLTPAIIDRIMTSLEANLTVSTYTEEFKKVAVAGV